MNPNANRARARLRWLLAGAAVMAGATRAHATPRTPALGVMTDVGVPDGATVSVVYRPVRMLRFGLGASHNLVGPGVRAGVTFAPLAGPVTPTLSLSAGHFAERDANPLARRLNGDPTYSSPALERFGYDYADAHAGIALGGERATFFLDAGVARIVGEAHELDRTDGTSTMVTYTEDPQITATTFSARVGFVVYIL